MFSENVEFQVLVVEDEDLTAKMLERTIEKLFKKPHLAYTGGEAIDKALSMRAPLLVILDWNLPDTDGLEVCMKLKKDCVEPLYIVFLTSKNTELDIATALSAGADNYMCKPFNRIELQARLHAGVRTLEREVQLKYYLSNQKKIVDSLPVGLLALTKEGAACSVNSVFYSIFGVTEEGTLDKDINDLSSAVDLPELKNIFEGVLQTKERSILSNIQIKSMNKTVDLIGNPVIGDYEDLRGILITISDVTEKKYLQDTMEQMRKFEAIGQLAAGVAHEINSPAQFISENLEFLKETFADLQSAVDDILPDDSILSDALEGIFYDRIKDQLPRAIDRSIIGIQQISHIVKAMNELSHPGSNDFSLVNINELLDTVTTLSKNKWKYIADLECRFDENLKETIAVPEELHQVFLNMIVNASHALDDKFKETNERGLIVVSTQQLPELVRVVIEDNGTGINPEYLKKIFDPFFTTKEVGKGTGQGLAISHQIIVERHKGALNVESEKGKGTKFIIDIPLNRNLESFKSNNVDNRGVENELA